MILQVVIQHACTIKKFITVTLHWKQERSCNIFFIKLHSLTKKKNKLKVKFESNKVQVDIMKPTNADS